MKKRLLAGVMSLCIGVMAFSPITMNVYAQEQSEDVADVQYYSDVSDIIGPIRPPKPDTNDTDKPTEPPATLPNTDELHSNEDYKKYDPNYPEKHQYGKYTLTIPALKDRLTFSIGNQNQLVGTLFAPGVSRSEGWNDATKKWGSHDSGLCFAASTSNLLSWYLKRYVQLNPNSENEFETDVEDIFNKFRNGWDPDAGGDPTEALSWYFTGGFPSNNHNPNGSELTGREKGGYLKGKIPNNTSKRWSWLSFNWQPEEVFSVYGGYEDDEFPYMEEVGGIMGDGAFNTLEGFSKQVIRQLHYGACSISIIAKQSVSVVSHSITLWGADYDVKTGLVTAIHVTDSDDANRRLFTVKVDRNYNNDGVRLVDYNYNPPTGGYQNFTQIRGSIVLYAPDVVKKSSDYIGEKVIIDSLKLDSDGRGVTVQVSNVVGPTIEYGYSYDNNPDNVVLWQKSNYFSDLEPDQYYFFARVNDGDGYGVGGMSNAEPYRIKTPSPISNENVPSLMMETSELHAYNGDYQYIWYGAEKNALSNTATEPMLWRVLDTQANNGQSGLFVISDKLYGNGKNGDLSFSNQSPYNNVYQNSNAQLWCKDFEIHSFKDWEQNAIMSTTKTDEQYSDKVIFEKNQDILLNDKVFLPSAEEITNKKYGFEIETNRLGKYHNKNSAYWLRSPVMNASSNAGYVDNLGNVGSNNTISSYAARPAFNLDASQVLYLTSAGGGQFANSNIGLERIKKVNSRDFRIVIKDENRKFSVAQSELNGSSGEKVSLQYNGANVSQTDNEYISVIIMDTDAKTPIYYGKLAIAKATDGEISFEIPADLSNGRYLMKVFNEEYNGYRESCRASKFCDVYLTVKNKDEVNPISQVNITVTAPISGQKPQMAESKDESYTVEKTVWTPDHKVFQPNTQYSVSVQIKAKDGYKFTDSTVFKLNGKPTDFKLNGQEGMVAYTDFTKTEDVNSGDNSSSSDNSSLSDNGSSSDSSSSSSTPSSGTASSSAQPNSSVSPQTASSGAIKVETTISSNKPKKPVNKDKSSSIQSEKTDENSSKIENSISQATSSQSSSENGQTSTDKEQEDMQTSGTSKVNSIGWIWLISVILILCIAGIIYYKRRKDVDSYDE